MFSRPLLTALFAGLISAIGFAPLNWWPVALLAFAVLLWLTWSAPTLKSVLLRGWVFGVGHFTVGNNWIQHAFDYQDKMPPVLGYFAVVLLALYLAVYPAFAMGLAWRFVRLVRSRAGWQEPDLAFVLAAAASWILTEYLRGVLFTGYPWNPLGVIWLPTPIVHLAAWIGTYALSSVALLAAGLLFLAAQRQYRPLLIGAPLLAVLGSVPSLYSLAQTGSSDARPNVRIVQPNIGQEGVGAADYPERVLAKLLEWSGHPGEVPRLLVWPEGTVNYYVEDGYPDARFYARGDPRWVRARIATQLGPRDIALIGGTALFFGKDGQLTGAGNSVWSLDATGTLGQRYDKAHLVPYGEYLPMRTLLAPLGLARLVMGDVDFIPGPGPRAIDTPGFGKAGIQICYEIIFSGQVVDRRNRPDFLFNPSNDAWFGRWGPPQHLAQARLRAIEEGLPILRSTPTGISAVIDARGRVLESIPHGQEGAIEVALPQPLPPTLFARMGNWLAFLVAGALYLFAIAFRRLAR
ncbi:apolipoprotein N-acyltransferase [Sphingomonas psychrotolerans]|uniref:Apolipoprotein N-acyltransferase n=1 Tax=Sphingomonas psychrotolerans TaxID=1327635 RepID=A0ABU3N3M9_9SPHN|nr:apolipoprotein N-acyltransferase [Sphingomonas psychrotolerans]MDT8759132.1 apolipoprotein N-acyltransferase [Sphingomonas psychrotolerans]